MRLTRPPDAPDPPISRLSGAGSGPPSRPRAVDLFCGAGGLEASGCATPASPSSPAPARPVVRRDPHRQPRRARLSRRPVRPRASSSSTSTPGASTGRSRRRRAALPAVLARRHSKIRSLVACGERTADDPRAELWRGFIAVVEHLRPRAVLVENVPGSAALGRRRRADRLLRVAARARLRRRGPDPRRVPHGVPQHRARLFIVGFRDGRPFDWPEPRAERADPPGRDRRPAAGPAGAARGAIRLPRRADARHFSGGCARDVPTGERAARHRPHHPRRAPRRRRGVPRCSARDRPTSTCPSGCGATAPTSSTTSTSGSAGTSVSRSITAHIAKDGYWYIHPSSTGRSRSGRPPGSRPSRLASASPASRPTATGRSATPCRRCSRRPSGRAIATRAASAAAGRQPDASTSDSVSDLLDWHGDHARSYPVATSGMSPWQVLMAEMCLHRTRPTRSRPSSSALGATRPDAGGDARARGPRRSRRCSRWGCAGAPRTSSRSRGRWSTTSTARCPTTSSSCASLPGVGDYVAQAVLCFGFGRRACSSTRTPAGSSAASRARRGRVAGSCASTSTGSPGRDGPDAAFNYALLDLGRADLPGRDAALRRLPDPRATAPPAPGPRRRPSSQLEAEPMTDHGPSHRDPVRAPADGTRCATSATTCRPRSPTWSTTASTPTPATSTSTIGRDGADSWIRVADDGIGMTARELDEAMRYGSDRDLRGPRLGHFGLGLKTASLSQCRRLTVAHPHHRARPHRDPALGPRRGRRHDSWELERLTPRECARELTRAAAGDLGTVVLWERLDRVLGYRRPDGGRRDGARSTPPATSRASTSRWSSTASSPASCAGAAPGCASRQRRRADRLGSVRARRADARSACRARAFALTSRRAASTGSRCGPTCCPAQIHFSSPEAHARGGRAQPLEPPAGPLHLPPRPADPERAAGTGCAPWTSTASSPASRSISRRATRPSESTSPRCASPSRGASSGARRNRIRCRGTRAGGLPAASASRARGPGHPQHPHSGTVRIDWGRVAFDRGRPRTRASGSSRATSPDFDRLGEHPRRLSVLDLVNILLTSRRRRKHSGSRPDGATVSRFCSART